MSYADDRNKEQREIQELRIKGFSELFQKILWIAIPLGLGGGITLFAGPREDIQLIAWIVLAAVAILGYTGVSTRQRRIAADLREEKRWNDLNENLDKRFNEVGDRFDEVDKRFDKSDATDKTLLRNELLKMHREYYQVKGYITVEALEYAEKLHEQYNAVGGNDLGDQMYSELLTLPKFQSESMVPTELRAKGADLCMATGEHYTIMHPAAK